MSVSVLARTLAQRAPVALRQPAARSFTSVAVRARPAFVARDVSAVRAAVTPLAAPSWKSFQTSAFKGFKQASLVRNNEEDFEEDYEDDGTLGIQTNPVPSAMIQKVAPYFTAKAVVNGQIKDVSLLDYQGKYLVLFFYPLDFTFVCPTEIIAFSDRVEEFRKIGAEVVAVSVDSVYSHLAFVNTPRKQGGLGKMNIPLVADLNKRISRSYGVLLEEAGISLRGLFVIDPKSVVRQITVNDLPVGRSVDEVLRLVQAFQFTDKHGEVCPANWTPGERTIKPSPKDSLKYFENANK